MNDHIADGDQDYAVTTGPASSADCHIAASADPPSALTNINYNTAGIDVTPTSGLQTDTNGGTASFAITLNSKPTADVTIPLASSDTNQGTVSASSLTFTPANWNVAQSVTVTGVNDHIADGNQGYTPSPADRLPAPMARTTD